MCILLGVLLYTCMYMHHMSDGCHREQEEGTGIIGTGIMCGYEGAMWEQGMEPRSS